MPSRIADDFDAIREARDRLRAEQRIIKRGQGDAIELTRTYMEYERPISKGRCRVCLDRGWILHYGTNVAEVCHTCGNPHDKPNPF